MLRSQFAIDHLSNSFSISFISSHKREISTSRSTYIFLSRLLEIKTSHALRRLVFILSSAFSQEFNFSPLVPSRAASVSSATQPHNCPTLHFTGGSSRLHPLAHQKLLMYNGLINQCTNHVFRLVPSPNINFVCKTS